MNKKNWAKILKPMLIILLMVSTIPSIIYLIQNKTILNFDKYFTILFNDTDRLEQTVIYIIILAIITTLYVLILKNRDKIFKNIKQVYIFIAISATICIFIIPFISSDIFYYLGIGRLDSKYGQNPYYTTITEFVESEDNAKYLENDTTLSAGYSNPWSDTTVVYGPIWTLICKIIAGMSFGNIDIGILLFKILGGLAHILNCCIIYKLTKKKIFVLLYGLNPFILLEGIANVHNDMYIITFVLASIYFLIKKKNILASITFLALATAIKYFTILLLPFIIIYHFRDKKPLERFKNCIIYGIIFILIMIIPYLLYIQDWTVLMGIFTQQEKFAKNFYIILMEYFPTIPNLVTTVNKTLLGGFIIIYLFTCITLISKRQIKFGKEIRKCEYFLIAFLFLLITNFQTWYIMWLFPLLMWQKAKNIKLITQISIISQFANSVFMINGEGWENGTPFTFFMLLGICACLLIERERGHLKLRKENS